jgi:chemotaxis signal transduction protein
MSGIHVRVRVGAEHYALAVEQVLEVAEAGRLTPVPGAPSQILGVHNLRGQVIPVIALAGLLGLPQEQPARILVAELGERRAGLAVDAVLDVVELPPASEQSESPYLSGTALVDGTLVGILDVETVLTPLSAPEAPA